MGRAPPHVYAAAPAEAPGAIPGNNGPIADGGTGPGSGTGMEPSLVPSLLLLHERLPNDVVGCCCC